MFIGLSILLFPHSAKSEQWEFKPSTCITEQQGDMCTLLIIATPPKNTVENELPYCFFAEKTLIECTDAKRERYKLKINISKNTDLIVKLGSQVVSQQRLLVQTLARKETRRRVRDPWSLF